MPEKVPFKAISFSFNDRAHGRMVVRMKYISEEERTGDVQGPYLLHIEQGPAERTIASFTTDASFEQASILCEKMLEAGVFSWDEDHADDPTIGPSRWMLNVVFEPDVFEIHSRGGSMYPVGFDAMMEAFYDLGLPRPDVDKGKSSSAGLFDMPLSDAGGLGMGFFNPAAMQGLMSQMQQMMDKEFGSVSFEDLQMVMRDMQTDPSRMQELMRSEFRSMSVEQQNALLDMLASTGIGSREWWKNFLLG